MDIKEYQICALCRNKLSLDNFFKSSGYYCKECRSNYYSKKYEKESFLCECGSMVNMRINKNHRETKKHHKGIEIMEKIRENIKHDIFLKK